MLGELKGVGTVALRCRARGHDFELLSYPDESWAIRRDGEVIDSWEAVEEESCMKTFGRLIGLSGRQDDLTVIFVKSTSPFVFSRLGTAPN